MGGLSFQVSDRLRKALELSVQIMDTRFLRDKAHVVITLCSVTIVIRDMVTVRMQTGITSTFDSV